MQDAPDYYRPKDLDGFKYPRFGLKGPIVAHGFLVNVFSQQRSPEGSGDQRLRRHRDFKI